MNFIKDRTYFAIGLALLGSLCFAFQDTGVKWLVDDVAVVHILFLRNVFAIVLLCSASKALGNKLTLSSSQPRLLLFRSLVNVLSWYLFFTGLKYMAMAPAVALFFSFPMMLTALSIPLLGETVKLRRWLAILVGFIGVLFITQPGLSFHWSSLLMLGAAFGWSLVAITTRKLGNSSNSSSILLHTLVTFCVVFFIPQFWVWQELQISVYAIIGVIAFFGVIAQLCMVKAYSITSPSVVSSFEYSGLVWVGLLGYLVWGEIPNSSSLVGAGLIVISGLYIIKRESLLKP